MDECLGIALLVNTALSFIVSHVASVRGKSSGGFFALSFLASFLVGILVLIALTGNDNTSDKDRAPCPFCDEAISPNAKICQFCKSNVVTHFENLSEPAAVKAQAEADEAEREEEDRLESLGLREHVKARAKIFVGVVAVGFVVLVVFSLLTS
jgi:hypothetical protein